ncbi:hypothetical protein LSAT2_026250 [Lamellibrachia satsuma]|nr:hypothetical protein LSAT2_026250 [Lamellibrachia satsuma]
MAAEVTGNSTTPSTTDTNSQPVDTNIEDTNTSSQSTDTVESDRDSNAPSDEAGLIFLHEIIQSGSNDCANEVDLLLSSTAVDVNAVASPGGSTALHLAAQLTDEFVAEDVALQLLKHGADPDIKDMSLRTAADYAFSQGHGHLAQYLSFGGSTVDEAIAQARNRREEHFTISLRQATKSAMVDDVRTCLELGANPNALNQHGVGALHFAVARCPADCRHTIVEMLVNGGADVNLRDHEGDTALNLLIKCGNNDSDGNMSTLVKYLLEKGTNNELTDLDGKDATMLATERQYDDIVSLLPMVQCSKADGRKDDADETATQKEARVDSITDGVVGPGATKQAASPEETTGDVESTENEQVGEGVVEIGEELDHCFLMKIF